MCRLEIDPHHHHFDLGKGFCSSRAASRSPGIAIRSEGGEGYEGMNEFRGTNERHTQTRSGARSPAGGLVSSVSPRSRYLPDLVRTFVASYPPVADPRTSEAEYRHLEPAALRLLRVGIRALVSAPVGARISHPVYRGRETLEIPQGFTVMLGETRLPSRERPQKRTRRRSRGAQRQGRCQLRQRLKRVPTTSRNPGWPGL